MVEKKDDSAKVRLKMFTEKLCPKCICGAKSPEILEVTDTHVTQINYLGVKEKIALVDYDSTMKAAGVYDKALDAFLDQSMTEKEVKVRRKRLKVLCQTKETVPECPTCNRLVEEDPGTVYCFAQHGKCPLCNNWRRSGYCRCLTSELDATTASEGPTSPDKPKEQ